jgi:hypothetical protein
MAKKASPGDLEPPQTVPAKPAAGAPETKRPPAPAAAAPAPAEASRQNASPAQAASAPAPEKNPPAAPASVRDPPPPAPSGPPTVRAAAPSPPPAPNSSAAQPVPEPAAEAETAPADPNATVEARLKSEGDNLALRFPFADPTPAAVFRRADMLWLVFDSNADIKLAGLRNDPSHNIKSATVTRQRGVSIVRIKLERPRLASVATEGATWVVNIGSQVIEPTRPLGITRNGAGQSRPTVAIMIDDPREVHQLEDPEAGDSLLLVTALAPARGFVNGQDFVEFRLLASAQGIVVQPLADDLHAELAPDRVVLMWWTAPAPGIEVP